MEEPDELLFTIWIVHVLVSRTWELPLAPVIRSSVIVQSWSMGPAELPRRRITEPRVNGGRLQVLRSKWQILTSEGRSWSARSSTATSYLWLWRLGASPCAPYACRQPQLGLHELIQESVEEGESGRI